MVTKIPTHLLVKWTKNFTIKDRNPPLQPISADAILREIRKRAEKGKCEIIRKMDEIFVCVGKKPAKTGTWGVDIPWHDQEEGKI
jgi:hypothetical protein